jgi:ABC-2 type transport system ATP-binding protein
LAEVEASCARAIIVSRGRIVADGPLDEIRAKSGRVRYVVSIQESAAAGSYRGRGSPPKQSEVEEALNKLEGVKKVGELPTDDRAHMYELVSEQEVDLRPEVFKLVVDKGWVMLELHRDSQTLEDVFRSLTIGDERRNRQLTSSGRAEGADDEDEDDAAEDEDEEEAESPKSAGTNLDTKAAKEERS